LVIGVPARNEASNIVELADRIEAGVALLGESTRTEMVLALQPGGDDTLERWSARRARLASRVLVSDPREAGKGNNVKRLIVHAVTSQADLLLVDADLRDYPQRNVSRFVETARRDQLGLVLPIWCRARGQANTTNYLASPLLRAGFGARIRQPLAGHVFLRHSFMADLDLEAVPGDYGVDIAITMAALRLGVAIGQVHLAAPEHDAKAGNSERIMQQVATAALGGLAAGPSPSRADVEWPDRYWDELSWPSSPSAPESWDGVIARYARPSELARWRELLAGPPARVTAMWCERLADAVRQARVGAAPSELAAGLTAPFFVHAESRRRWAGPDVADLEQYVAHLGERVAAELR